MQPTFVEKLERIISGVGRQTMAIGAHVELKNVVNTLFTITNIV
jgi:hypothetical protein